MIIIRKIKDSFEWSGLAVGHITLHFDWQLRLLKDKYAHLRQNLLFYLLNMKWSVKQLLLHSLNFFTVWLQSQLPSQAVIRYKSSAAQQRCRKIWWRCSRGGVRSRCMQCSLSTSRGQGAAGFGAPKICTSKLLVLSNWRSANELGWLQINQRLHTWLLRK